MAAAGCIHVSLIKNKNNGCYHENPGQNHRELRKSCKPLPLITSGIGLGASSEYAGKSALFSLLQQDDPGKGKAEQNVDNTKKGLHVAHLLENRKQNPDEKIFYHR
jgi:hypothetical protein